ncbi:MAG: mechanosensitive ion channel family protein, partial [Candidatus Bathyarchaeia archaeon]
VVFVWGYLWRAGPETVLPRWGYEVWATIGVASALAGAYVFYVLSSKAIRGALLRAGGTEGDVKMTLGLWKFVVVFIVLLIVLNAFFQLGAIGAIIGAFGGMFLGWSLQAPVSGFAAWLLVTIRRPFRVGDRVLLPSYGLVGDVLDVGPMYTVLNQVGGAVGSEEPVNRHILIPNAMLFGNLVINYTPKWEKGIPPSVEHKEQVRAFILDEVVWNIPIGSNLEAAEKILVESAKEVTAEIIAKTGQQPYVRGESYSTGVTMRLRYMTLATDRPRIAYEINKRIFTRLYRPFKTGDRISIPAWGITGDVVDVGPMFTTLNQVGGSVGSEEPVNRTITIPNSALQGTWVINYTPEILEEKTVLPTSEAKSYILDETVWRITFDSDWGEAEKIMIESAAEVTADIIKATGKQPYVRSDVYDYGIYMRLRYMTLATDRPRILHEINKRIFERISKAERVDFAIPYVYSYKRGMQYFSRPIGLSSSENWRTPEQRP